MRRFLPVGLACLVATLADAPARAVPPVGSPLAPQQKPGSSRPDDQRLAEPRVHPEAVALFTHLARTKTTLPLFRPSPAFEKTGLLPVVVRFRSPLSDAKARDLVARGVRLPRGNRAILSGAYLARVTREGLAALDADPEVTRVSVDLPHLAALPLDGSATETRAAIARRATMAKEGTQLDGTGTLIADIDSAAHILHPAFFRADAGVLPWVDVDGDGTLTPGTDGVDLDDNGAIEAPEVLRLLAGRAVSRLTGNPIAAHKTFTPDLDFLFLDTNGNDERDAGEGFTEATPAYGEPLFVFDDANHDGVLDPSERLLRLGTSKYRAIASDEGEYTRGGKGANALIAYEPSPLDPAFAAKARHATAVSGIVLGGQPGVSRWLGLAPGAELILSNRHRGEGGPIAALQWAIDHKANVILTEYAPFMSVSLDGSSEEEMFLDAANDEGVLTVSPAGNLGGSYKHRTVTLPPAATTTLALSTDPQLTTATSARLSIHYKGAARSLTAGLKLPSGTIVPLPSGPDPATTGSLLLYGYPYTTPRGTHEHHSVLVATSGTIPLGNYGLVLTLGAGAPLEVDVYASDDVSSWQGGFTFKEDTPTRTICSPSTSDKTISVGAYVLHEEPAFGPAGLVGELSSYSSRGPLLYDRAPGIELLAPDNPISTSVPLGSSSNGVDYAPFGGTSGAGPHVAAAIALLRQALPAASPEEIRKRLYDSARPEKNEGAGESPSGHGKLDIAAAAGATVTDGTTPTIQLAPAPGGVANTLRVDAVDDEPLEALTARWDLDYDGIFDTDWLPLGDQAIPIVDKPVGATIGVKVEVRDGQGNVNGATANLIVAAPTLTTAAPITEMPANDDGCGCKVTGSDFSRGGHPGVGLAAIALALLVARRRRARLARDDNELSLGE